MTATAQPSRSAFKLSAIAFACLTSTAKTTVGPSAYIRAVEAVAARFSGRRISAESVFCSAAANRADLPEWCAISQGGAILGWVNARYLSPDAGAPADLPLMRGFRGDDDPCRLVGESAATVNYLDHTRWLVGCPAGSTGLAEILEEFGGDEVDRIGGYVLISVPGAE